ncbi:MAG: transglutaminase domain-containing protein [Deltaproteobacteria bacterium]|nr:transglutaminase domain-containing protein [Deltaproteobacteria bacterium]
MLCLVLCAMGCATALPGASSMGSVEVEDEAVPARVAVWLGGGEQSEVTERIRKAAERLPGGSRRARLHRAMAHMWETFSYDPWLKTEAFQRTADELFAGRVLCGCSDFALVQIALFRALGIPARMVITCNVDWIHVYRRDGVSMAEGHSFIEVYLEDRWHLVDSTYRWLFSDYDPKAPFYPHGEIFCRRGMDFWDMGIQRMADLDRVLKEMVIRYEGGYQAPDYPRHPL